MRRVTLLAWPIFFATALGLGALTGDAADSVDRIAHVGYVAPGSPSTTERQARAFWQRLRELGWIEGQNLIVETSWADNQRERLPALMADMIGRKVDVLVTYSIPGAAAAKQATRTVPIVVASMGDPIGAGLVESLARPGGNLTGLSTAWGGGIEGKWLELLQETVPRLSTVAVISNPDNPLNARLATDLSTIAVTRGLKLRVIDIRHLSELDRVFEQASRIAQAVLVLPDTITVTRPESVAALAAKRHLPSVYGFPVFVPLGGLMSYGPDPVSMYRRAADYVDKILRGAKPADLPIEEPTKFELVVNLKTAKALGITIPQSIMVRADAVIR